ncbi:MAG: hypothetical protein HN509_18765 [Halobacteriovoraceae bacterium]|nr:hypothetical protein [Halobacteriovoraceae bacterium]MBT5093027.1 hypothetical protein [Halobacteriovoraceae bacterium]
MKKILATALLVCTMVSPQAMAAKGSRGLQHEYDAGAPKESRWPDLFAETPNYRAFGQAVIGGRGEKFRWKMGPMFYRGRLTPNSVKVFVIGQEGAQDENVSNRSFTGSTGTRMQRFLNYLGIDRSYLFMNTFVYTITGQYSLFGEDRENARKVKEQKRLLWLAQNEDSIVVKHRHELFDYMLETNRGTLALVIGVGTAGKDSAANWLSAHGAKCSNSKLTRSYCRGTGALAGVVAIGVKHPGAASARNGGEAAGIALRKDFQKKANIVRDLIESKGEGYLPLDPGMSRGFSEDFKYGYASVPHRDFAFGTNWRMGNWATTSNRRGSDTIQVFASPGSYNNEKNPDLRYDDPRSASLNKKPVEMAKGDLPFESPKSKQKRRQYDAGPGADFGKVMLEFFNQDFWEAGVTGNKAFGPQGVYRGRLDSARVLILADQMSHTDMFSGRALTGAAGQRLQSLLKAAGQTDSYAILRTLPVDTMDLSVDHVTRIALQPSVDNARINLIDEVLAYEQTEVVITIGPVAEAALEGWDLGVQVINLDIADPALKHVAGYRSALKQLKSLGLKSDSKPTWSYNGTPSIIPRKDLPAYTRWWMGTSGDLAARSFEWLDGERVDNPNYYKVYAPKWNNSWRAKTSDLTSAEKASLRDFTKTGL